MDLRDRLRRIREIRRDGGPPPAGGTRENFPPPPPPSAPAPGWVPLGRDVLKRTVITAETIPFPDFLPRSLGLLAPDLFFTLNRGEGELPRPEDLLFFDLETSGLSGGAGTVAFLAAFGRLEAAGPGKWGKTLRLDQYLLLDYPGEGDFLEALIAEMENRGRPPLLATYNGKSFDAQIFRNRCLMNGLTPPEFRHLDLLHPCRFLWKRVLPSCSQAGIEGAILGLDREGDVSGALAPEIWFSFLKTGDFHALGGITDHNLRDITGLARILAALAEIARSPLENLEAFHCDPEALALRWRKALRRRRKAPFPPGPPGSSPKMEEFAGTGEALLWEAARQSFPRAAFLLALDLFRLRRYDEGLPYLERCAGDESSGELWAAALGKLALDAERRLRRPDLALAYTERALAGGGEGLRGSLIRELEARRGRLLKKYGRGKG